MCSHYLTASEGCEFCLPIKPHLVFESTVPEQSRVTTEQLCQDAAFLLSKLLHEIRNSIEDGSFSVLATERLTEATRALTGLVAQMRLLDEAEASKARRMTYEEQVNAFEQFFESLPAKHRDDLILRFQGVLIKKKSLSLVP